MINEKIRKCPYCEKEIMIEAKLCKHCKKKVEIIKCPQCAEIILKDDKTCCHCGTLLKKTFDDYAKPIDASFKNNQSSIVGLVFFLVIAALILIYLTIDSKKNKWHDLSYKKMTFDEASDYCKNLGKGWRLPSMDELRTLIKNCPATEKNGSCNYNDTAWMIDSNNPCRGCGGDANYSVLGDSVILMSDLLISSSSDKLFVLSVNFYYGGFDLIKKDSPSHFRCIRTKE